MTKCPAEVTFRGVKVAFHTIKDERASLYLYLYNSSCIMHNSSLTPAENKLLQAFRALSSTAQKQLLSVLEELREKSEDEQDSLEAERILARIRYGEEELIPLDEVVKQLGFEPGNFSRKK